MFGVVKNSMFQADLSNYMTKEQFENYLLKRPRSEDKNFFNAKKIRIVEHNERGKA